MEDHSNTKKELDEMFQSVFFDEKRFGKFLWMVKCTFIGMNGFSKFVKGEISLATHHSRSQNTAN
jgi:hypothetical protein